MSNLIPTINSSIEFKDERGSMEILHEGIGFNAKIIKMTRGVKGALRGFHYQHIPKMQNKKIYVIEGVIQDVTLKIDKEGNPTSEYVEHIISAIDGIKELSIPANWAHAYLTLSNQSKVLYVCDNEYGNEMSYNPISFFGGWQIPTDQLIISDKDLR